MNIFTPMAIDSKASSSWRSASVWVFVGLIVLLTHVSLEQRRYWQQELTGQVGAVPAANLILLSPQQTGLPTHHQVAEGEGNGDDGSAETSTSAFLLLLLGVPQSVFLTAYLSLIYLAPRRASYSPRSPPRINPA